MSTTTGTSIWQPLNAVEKEIRLCKLQPSATFDDDLVVTLEVVSLRSRPVYDALSYAWGDRASDTTLTANGGEASVSLSVDRALRHLRHPSEPISIWIDSLSIHQTDLDELKAQVLMMSEIYTTAETVRIWLGEPDQDDDDQALSILSQVARGTSLLEMKIDGRRSLTNRDLDSIRRLGNLPWWSRVWIIQEAILAEDAVVHYGHGSMPLNDLYRVRENIEEDYIHNSAKFAQRFPEIYSSSLMQHLSRFMQFWALRRPGVPALDAWIMTLAYARSSNTTDDRDKIYGLLGLFASPAQRLVRPDYALAVGTIYTNFAFDVIRQSRTLSICNQSASTRNPDYGVPSWAPDWSVGESALFDNARRFGQCQIFAACGPHRAEAVELLDGRVLRIEGFMFDGISQIGLTFTDTAGVRGEFEAIMQWRSLLGIESWRKRHSAYVAGGGLHLAYWVTLFNCLTRVDLARETGRARRVALTDYWYYLRWWRWEKTLAEGNGLLDPSKEPSAVAVAMAQTASQQTPLVDDDIRTAISERRLMVSSKGFIGLVPSAARVGDQIFVLKGGSHPYVLRQRRSSSRPGPTRWEFIGDCYVHGIMDGEAVSPPVYNRPLKALHALRSFLFGGSRLDAVTEAPAFVPIELE